jgi:hypothetical protein
MEIGKLYQNKQLVWFLYPSKETAFNVYRPISNEDGFEDGNGTIHAFYYCKRLDCNMSYLPRNSIFIFLDKIDQFYKILTAEGIRWIIITDRWKDDIEEVKY